MASNETNNAQYLSIDNSENRSASAPPSISSFPSSRGPTDTSHSPSQKLQIHPILEAQTESFNEIIAASDNTAEMAHYSSNTCEYSYPASTSGAPYSSSQISQVSISIEDNSL